MSSPRFSLVLCYAAMTALAAAVNLLPVFLTTLSADLGGLTDEQLGRIAAVTIGGLVLGIISSGPLADRVGLRVFAVGGNLLIAAGLVWMAYAPDYASVLAATATMGLGAGALDMVLSPIVAALCPDRRTVAMNLLHSFYCSGAVVVILAGAVALKLGYGWRELAGVLAIWPVVVGLGFWRVPLPPLVAEGDVRTPLRHLLGQRSFVLALIAIGLGGATEAGMAYWLPAYAEKTLMFSPFVSGVALAAFTLMMTIGRLGIGWLPPSWSPVQIMLVGCALSVVLFMLASFAPVNGVALAACVLAGLTGSCLWPSVLAVTADRFPSGGATMFALLAALGNVGATVMPWLVGGVADASTMRLGLATAGLCPLLMIGVLLMMRTTPVAPPRPAV
ncbi:MAG TPA: MFS transporter [Tepidisphaeraceae bacterium]|jgi:MFS family permease